MNKTKQQKVCESKLVPKYVSCRFVECKNILYEIKKAWVIYWFPYWVRMWHLIRMYLICRLTETFTGKEFISTVTVNMSKCQKLVLFRIKMLMV